MKKTFVLFPFIPLAIFPGCQVSKSNGKAGQRVIEARFREASSQGSIDGIKRFVFESWREPGFDSLIPQMLSKVKAVSIPLATVDETIRSTIVEASQSAFTYKNMSASFAGETWGRNRTVEMAGKSFPTATCLRNYFSTLAYDAAGAASVSELRYGKGSCVFWGTNPYEGEDPAKGALRIFDGQVWLEIP